ncbi:MAG: ECF transporter S component [Anaerovoracaceae bacterium]
MNNQTQTLNTQKNTMKLAKMGMLVAISIVLVSIIHFPIFPAVPFLEYDPADIPILIGTFAFGPVAGLLLTIVTSVIQGLTVSSASGLYGILMHIIATGTFVIVAGNIYNRHKSKKFAIIGLAVGALAMAAIMAPANIFITPYFMGAPKEVVIQLLPFILAFNLVKAGINGIVTLVLYKKISKFLHK